MCVCFVKKETGEVGKGRMWRPWPRRGQRLRGRHGGHSGVVTAQEGNCAQPTTLADARTRPRLTVARCASAASGTPHTCSQLRVLRGRLNLCVVCHCVALSESQYPSSDYRSLRCSLPVRQPQQCHALVCGTVHNKTTPGRSRPPPRRQQRCLLDRAESGGCRHASTSAVGNHWG